MTTEEKLSRVQEDMLAKITDYIRRNSLSVDYHLTEAELVEEFGVSRSPIRVALGALARRGLVTFIPNKGYYLAQDASALDEPDDDDRPSDLALYDRIAMDRMRDDVPEQFTEAAFMRRYDVSRAQLVRTLTLLTHDGLVRRGNGHGWIFLAVLNSEEAYKASYRFRILIEPAAILEPTYKLNTAAIARVRRDHDRILELSREGEADYREVFRINSEFHEMIAEMSGNPFIQQSIRHQNRLRKLSEYFIYRGNVRIEKLVQEHLAIMDAMVSGDRAWASSLLRHHLETASRQPTPFKRS